MFLTNAFVNLGASVYGWETLYAGYRWDTTSGSYVVRNRIYLSILGTWGSRDPLVYEPGSLSLYQYVDSQPTVSIDAYGLANLWYPLTWGIPSPAQGWVDFLNPLSQESRSAIAGSVIGGAQGVANTLNGVQDAIVAIPNIAPLFWNQSVGSCGGPRFGYIPSWDWSKDLIIERESTHGISKFLGGQGAFTLCTLGLSQLGNASKLRHFTSKEVAKKIIDEGVVTSRGGIFATAGSGVVYDATTSVITFPRLGGQVAISGTAAAAFGPIPVIGPISAFNRWLAAGYVAPFGSLNLSTGMTTPLLGNGLLIPQLVDLGAHLGLQLGAQSQMDFPSAKANLPVLKP